MSQYYTPIDYCRACHNTVSFVLTSKKGFHCPKCRTVHDLSGHCIPVIYGRKVLDQAEAAKLKASVVDKFSEACAE